MYKMVFTAGWREYATQRLVGIRDTQAGGNTRHTGWREWVKGSEILERGGAGTMRPRHININKLKNSLLIRVYKHTCVDLWKFYWLLCLICAISLFCFVVFSLFRAKLRLFDFVPKLYDKLRLFVTKSLRLWFVQLPGITSWHKLSKNELKNLSRVQRRRYSTIVNIK